MDKKKIGIIVGIVLVIGVGIFILLDGFGGEESVKDVEKKQEEKDDVEDGVDVDVKDEEDRGNTKEGFEGNVGDGSKVVESTTGNGSDGGSEETGNNGGTEGSYEEKDKKLEGGSEGEGVINSSPSGTNGSEGSSSGNGKSGSDSTEGSSGNTVKGEGTLLVGPPDSVDDVEDGGNAPSNGGSGSSEGDSGYGDFDGGVTYKKVKPILEREGVSAKRLLKDGLATDPGDGVSIVVMDGDTFAINRSSNRDTEKSYRIMFDVLEKLHGDVDETMIRKEIGKVGAERKVGDLYITSDGSMLKVRW